MASGGGFLDALIQRLQQKGEDVSNVIGPNSAPLDRLGSAVDLALTPVEFIGRAGEAAFGLTKAAGTATNSALGGGVYSPQEVSEAQAALTDPIKAIEYLHNRGTASENITANVANPLNQFGKASFVNELGKDQAVGALVKQLFQNPATRQVDTAALQAFLNSPAGRIADLAERGAALPLTAPTEALAKAIGGVGKVTGLSRLTQRAQATKNLDTATTEVADLQQKIDAAYSDVPAEQRPTPADFKSWQDGYRSGDADSTNKLQDMLSRLQRLNTGDTAPAAQAAAAAPQPHTGGPIPGQDPLARPALPGDAPVPTGPSPSEKVLQQDLAAAAGRAVTASQTTALPAAGNVAQRTQMNKVISDFEDWAQRFENPELKGIADRLRQGNLSDDEKQTFSVIYKVMQQGEGKAAPAAEAVASQAETQAPKALEAAAAPSARDQQLAEALGFTPEEVASMRQPGAAPLVPHTNGFSHATNGKLPPPVSAVGIDEATGTVSPDVLAANGARKAQAAQQAQDIAQQFSEQGVSKPSRAAIAKVAGVSPRSTTASVLQSKVQAALDKIAAGQQPAVDEAQALEQTLTEVPQEVMDHLQATHTADQAALASSGHAVVAEPIPQGTKGTVLGDPVTVGADDGTKWLRVINSAGDETVVTREAFVPDEAASVLPEAPAVNGTVGEGTATATAEAAPPALDARLSKLMKAAKREGIVDVIDGELQDKTPLERIAQQIKSIFPAAKSDEELMAVVQRVAQERGGTASLGAAAGFGPDENGNVQFDPQRAALGAVIGSVAPGNTRLVFKGPVAEELVQALGKRFGTANVSRGAENVLDLKVAGRLTEQALRKFLSDTASKLGVDLTDAVVAHPQGSDIGVLVKGADEKLQAMIQRVVPKGATVTPTADGLQVLLRQTPSGSRGAGTAAQQAAASRSLNAKLAEVVKAHGLNPDEVLQAGRPRVEPLGPTTTAAPAPQAAQAAAPETSVVDKLNQLLQQGGTDTTQLNSLLTKQQAVSAALSKDQQAAQDILSRIQAKVPQPIQTAQQAFDNSYAQRVASEDLKQLQQLQKKYGFDVLDQQQWADHLPKLTEERLITSFQDGVAPTALDKVAGSAAARYGLPAATLGTVGALSADDENKTKAAGLGAAAGLASASPLGRGLGASLKQILLLSPRYHVNNLSDIAVKSVLNGVKPFLSESTAASYLRDWGQLTPEGEKLLVNLDGGLLQSFSKASQEFHKVGYNVNKSVVEGFSKEIGDPPALIRFLKLSKPAQFNRQIAQTFERDARLAAYIQGKEQFLQSQVGGFADRLESLSPEAASAVRDSGGRVSQAKLAQFLDTAGVKGADRGNALGEWGKLLRAGDQHGADLANTIHFNYRYTTSFDEFMGQLMLFHIYSTRNLVYYPKLLAEHPMVAASILKLEQQSAEDADKRNLTSRFLGNVPAGEGASKLVSLLWGQNGEAFVNPAQYVSIVQQVLPIAKQLRSPDSSTNAVGSAVEGARNLGFGINPIGEIALGAGGALGDTVPSSGVLTPLQPLTAALRGLQGAGKLGPVGGSTIELDPTVGLTSGLIQGLGTDVMDFSQAAIRKRIAEMALEQGRAPGAYDAEVQNPNGPIYKEAVRQVAAQQATKGALSYAGGPNLQFLPDTEALVRGAKTGAPAFNPNANSLQRAVYGQRAQQSRSDELANSLSRTQIADTLSRTLQTDPQGVAKAAQDLGADVSRGPDGTLRVTVQGDTLNPTEMRQVLDHYQQIGGTIGLLSQTYSGINRDPEQLAQSKAKDTAETAQILAQYAAATPAQKAAMLADPNIRFVIATKQHINYTPNGAYR